ncbi:hypothetical protein P154DRAFT_582200 [Amniculicola lignicola CBS 123094]|uniref:Uncharacterized protein n=1 Tax=Amniculicola lignicola CBS 123094 TaxID=1392246 RepID=A0A6A5VWW9_9PLEO|nr:hypothetical protein P154DRAFT_582200 [Amniculicola lignicola CBS 123094]
MDLNGYQSLPSPYEQIHAVTLPPLQDFMASWRLSNSSSSGTTTPETDNEAEVRLRRYILEILAYTFSADIPTLARALGIQHNSFQSLLNDTERQELRFLSNLIKTLHTKLKHGEWNSTSDFDRQVIRRSVCTPVAKIHVDGPLVLDLIATYADHGCDPEKWKHTLISYWHPWPMCLARFLRGSFGRDAMKGHAKLISDASPNEAVRFELDRAMRAFVKEHWLENVQFLTFNHSGYLRAGFWELWRAIKR